MIKVMIVDDEPLSRVELVNMLKWREHGFIMVGTCENGRQGLELASSAQPDIVITDIRMPVMDGLEMIRALKRAQRNVCAIVLTGYAEFQYVQEALRLGAIDYIEKWKLDADYLLDVLERARRACLATAPARESAGISLEQHLTECLRGWEKWRDEGEEEVLRAGVNTLAELRVYGTEDGQYCDAQSALAVESVLQETLMTYERRGVRGFVATEAPHRYWLLLCLRDPDDVEVTDELMLRLRTMLGTCVGADLLCGLSTLRPDIRPAHSFRQALSCCEEAFWTQEHICRTARPCAASPVGLDVEALRARIIQGDALPLREWIDAALSALSRAPRPTRARVCGMLEQALFDVCRALGDRVNSDPGEQRLSGFATFTALSSAFQRACENLRARANRDGADGGDALSLAYDYIRARYTQPISLGDVARAVAMNPAYLSTQFKKRFGQGLIASLNALRVRQAKELLLSTNLSVSEIAARVGFDSASYFAKVFRSMTGHQPYAYRKRMRDDSRQT